ncbi:hypothetical protein [Salinisphaera sp.]|uniref:hypothetical protein n=1 Tax=Salinisphaera sp. TaxID=1914330 RepID=UPI000C655CF2|nr:hypothetical protein [Salinisphaera sp.]MBS62948.1 hypothetical protein [Salinisphaera sp.]
MFNRIRRRVRRLIEPNAAAAAPRDTTVQLRLPSPYGGAPWLTATVAISATPRGQGEALRLRAHVDGALRLPAAGAERPRLALDAGASRGLIRQGRSAAAAVARNVIERLPAQPLEQLASKRWRTWLDVQLSTSPLDEGAQALMPEPLRGIYGGGLPRSGTGEPRIGVWSGPAGGRSGGVAQLVLLQLDERDLGRSRGRNGRSAFNLNASVAQVVEPLREDDERD